MLFRNADLNEAEAIAELIYDTVHNVCCDDYTQRQLEAWAPKKFDIRLLKESLKRTYTCVADDNGKIVGVINIEFDGYINRLFVEKTRLRQGIATALLKKGEEWAKKNGIAVLTLEASLTAIPFYLTNGFEKSGKTRKIKNGVEFFNDRMVKFI